MGLFMGKNFAKNSGNDGLDYRVKFPDGLKPRVFVYGFDERTHQFYGAREDVGVAFKIGTEAKSYDRERFGRGQPISFEQYFELLGRDAFLDFNDAMHFSRGGTRFDMRLQKPDVPELQETNANEFLKRYWQAIERGTLDCCKLAEINCIWVGRKEDIQGALNAHMHAYVKQFNTLGERITEVFMGFVNARPGLGFSVGRK